MLLYKHSRVELQLSQIFEQAIQGFARLAPTIVT
jgi:hypothetical protein